MIYYLYYYSKDKYFVHTSIERFYLKTYILLGMIKLSKPIDEGSFTPLKFILDHI